MPQAQWAFAAQPVRTFAEVLNPSAYTPLPNDAWVAITDVQGSTQAIEGGRYKDVNLAGAAGIAAFANAFPNIELPFAFGGDGAAILLPGGFEDRARNVLAGLQPVAESALGLPLRTSLVPVRAIRDRGADVRLVYQVLEGGRQLAMLSGGGVARAEALAKTPEGDKYAVRPASDAPAPDLNGLSCRWQPVKPQRGTILTILVQGPTAPDAYLPVFDGIAAAAAGPQNPLSRPPLPSWPPRGIVQETKLRSPQRPLGYALSVLGQSALGAISTYSGFAIGGFDGRRYRDSLVKHCDALKFADGLKMVVDCTSREADAVETLLADMASDGRFAYGVQRSTSALMTCFVQTTADAGHVHFIDGAEGGYALAARQLKLRAGHTT